MLTTIREALRKIFPSLQISKAEIRLLLSEADRYMVGSKEEVGFMAKHVQKDSPTEPLFMRKEDTDPSPELIQGTNESLYHRTLKKIEDTTVKLRQGTAFKALLKTLPMTAKSNWFDKILPGVADFVDIVMRQAQMQDQLMSQAAQNISILKTNEQQEMFSVLGVVGTYLQVDPRKSFMEQDWVVENKGDVKKASAEYAIKNGNDIRLPKEQVSIIGQKVGRSVHAEGYSLRQAYDLAKELYSQDDTVAKAYGTAIDQMQKIRTLVFEEEVRKAMTRKEGQAQIDKIKALEKAYKNVHGAYFPIMRFGGYYIDVRREGEAHSLMNYEYDNPADWHRQHKKLRKDFAGDESIRVLQGRGLPSELREIEATSDRLYTDIMDSARRNITDPKELSKLSDSLNAVLTRAKPNTAAEASLRQRKNVPGFDVRDGLRSYTSYIKDMAGAYSNAIFGSQLDVVVMRMEALIKQRREEGILTTEEAILYDLQIHRKSQREDKSGFISKSLGKAAFIQYLTSPSIAFVQMSQLGVLTLPFLATRHGAVKSFKSMMGATRNVIRPESGYTTDDILNYTMTDSTGNQKKMSDFVQDYVTIEGESPAHKKQLQKQFIEDLGFVDGSADAKMFAIHNVASKGLIDITASHTALELAGGLHTTGLMYKMAVFMRVSESASRKVATLSAFELEGNHVSVESMEAVVDVVDKSLFNYSHVNKPQLLTGNEYVKVLTQFTTFNINMMVQLTRMAHVGFGMRSAKPVRENFASDEEYQAALVERSINKKNLVGVLGMIFMGAGTAGLPMLNTLFALLNLTLDDDDPEDYRQAFLRFIKEEFGQTAAETMDKGVISQLINADVSGRIGINSMNFTNDAPEYLEGRPLADRMAGDWLGPSWGIESGWLQGYAKAMDGDIQGGMIAAFPKVIKDPIKAVRTYSEGIKDGQGRRLSKDGSFSEVDLVMMALGFNPMSNALPKTANYELSKISTRLSERKSDLIRGMEDAINSGSQDAREKALAEANAFSRRNPSYRISGKDFKSLLKRHLVGDMGYKSRSQTQLINKYGLGVYTGE